MNAINAQACLPSFYVAFSVHGTDSWIVATTTEDVTRSLAILMVARPENAEEIVASEKDRFYVGQPLELPFGAHAGGMTSFTVGKSRRTMFPSKDGVKLLADRLQTESGAPTADPKKVLDFFLDLAAAGWRIAKYRDFVSYHENRLSAEKVQALVMKAEGDAKSSEPTTEATKPEKTVSTPEKVTEATLNAALVKHHITVTTYIQTIGASSQRRWEAFVGEFGSGGQGAVSNSPVNAVNLLLGNMERAKTKKG